MWGRRAWLCVMSGLWMWNLCSSSRIGKLQGAICWALSIGGSELLYCTFTLGSAPHQRCGELGWSTFLLGAENSEEGHCRGRAQGVPHISSWCSAAETQRRMLCVCSLGCRWEGLASPGSLGSEVDMCEHGSEVRSEKPCSPRQLICTSLVPRLPDCLRRPVLDYSMDTLWAGILLLRLSLAWVGSFRAVNQKKPVWLQETVLPSSGPFRSICGVCGICLC